MKCRSFVYRKLNTTIVLNFRFKHDIQRAHNDKEKGCENSPSNDALISGGKLTVTSKAITPSENDSPDNEGVKHTNGMWRTAFFLFVLLLSSFYLFYVSWLYCLLFPSFMFLGFIGFFFPFLCFLAVDVNMECCAIVYAIVFRQPNYSLTSNA